MKVVIVKILFAAFMAADSHAASDSTQVDSLGVSRVFQDGQAASLDNMDRGKRVVRKLAAGTGTGSRPKPAAFPSV